MSIAAILKVGNVTPGGVVVGWRFDFLGVDPELGMIGGWSIRDLREIAKVGAGDIGLNVFFATRLNA